MPAVDPILLEIDRLIVGSRLQEVAFIAETDIRSRLAKMETVLKKLGPGAYLLGTGSTTVGIIPVTVDEIALGRSATTLEEPTDTVIDYAVTDTLYFTPREVSRSHAKIVRRKMNSKYEYFVVDMKSTCGTFVNGVRVDPHGPGVLLSHGDVLSLGPSQMSTYMFYVVDGM
jgi:pSer/pThr/pTyr-binding forkhead associated (FHA) protein